MGRVTKTFGVEIETWSGRSGRVDDDRLHHLRRLLEDLGARGVATSVGGLARGPTATFFVEVERDGEGHAEVAGRAVGWFEHACEEARLRHGGVARLEVASEAFVDRELAQPSEGFAGVTEVARMLGVSRQRVSELRDRVGFPAPVAELAAGPVWTATSLERFVRGWERKPGRPRKHAQSVEWRLPVAGSDAAVRRQAR